MEKKILFTGYFDVPLTRKGVDKAIKAGKRISNILIDVIHTSTLTHVQMTSMLAMTQHRLNKAVCLYFEYLLLPALNLGLCGYLCHFVCNQVDLSRPSINFYMEAIDVYFHVKYPNH